ncbi:MAG: molybdate ABC transporter substrate-binding protein [Gammaproteobacteria bacterium]|nr:molybdate ABC transporter substrate-binding protein [Gammaproteobacteria bacterium]
MQEIQMKRIWLLLTLTTAGIVTLGTGPAKADEIRVAVSSNFTETIKSIGTLFEKNTGHKVSLIFGSTGKHYAQIKNGAPFHAFFAADTRRPELLEKEQIALPKSRFTYAVGKVVLWSPKTGYVNGDNQVLKQGKFRHIAIANPKLAPYGQAAQEILQTQGIWENLQKRVVRGENIGQTFQFVKSSNAELGFIAYSQIKRPGQPMTGSVWVIPQSLYSPINQQAVLLKENPTARAFLEFVRSKPAVEIIQAYGYGTL